MRTHSTSGANRRLRILMAASEVVPFSKSGGLADVAGALPKYLARLGHEVKVVTPRYLTVKRNIKIQQRDLSLEVAVPIGDEQVSATLWGSEIAGNAPVILVDQTQYFDRKGLYQENGIDYPDNAFRFAFFSRSVLEVIRKLKWIPDIIHCHDWQTALIPIFLRELYPDLQNTRTVFTFHNANFHGPKKEMPFLGAVGLKKELFRLEALEYYGRINFLKAGLIFADRANTVSSTYAREIQGNPLHPDDSYDYGAGLAGLYREISSRLTGILNGLDYEEWDPGTDKALGENRFDVTTVTEVKAKNKEALQKKFDLPVNPEIPLAGVVGRIDPGQKGYELLLDVIPQLADQAQIVLLGSGDPSLEKRASSVSETFPGTFRIKTAYDPELSRLIYAGSDFFLMPSRYEPCGLTQMIALRYGTIPIVRRTGGLADTIIDVSSDKASGNGFVFDEYSSTSLGEAIRRALEAFRDKDGWKTLRRRVMDTIFSWEDSVKKYEEIYYGIV